jgi:hypothetical protein
MITARRSGLRAALVFVLLTLAATGTLVAAGLHEQAAASADIQTKKAPTR